MAEQARTKSVAKKGRIAATNRKGTFLCAPFFSLQNFFFLSSLSAFSFSFLCLFSASTQLSQLPQPALLLAPIHTAHGSYPFVLLFWFKRRIWSECVCLSVLKICSKSVSKDLERSLKNSKTIDFQQLSCSFQLCKLRCVLCGQVHERAIAWLRLKVRKHSFGCIIDEIIE